MSPSLPGPSLRKELGSHRANQLNIGNIGNFGQSNYGAAKMGMLGFMNVLAIEGASHNVRVNCLSPAAATRMTASVPGSQFDASNPPPGMNPALVTPAVLYLCSEDAPSATTVHASGGRFSRIQTFTTRGSLLERKLPMKKCWTTSMKSWICPKPHRLIHSIAAVEEQARRLTRTGQPSKYLRIRQSRTAELRIVPTEQVPLLL